ncbi:MAG: hypothetical protein ACFBSE_02660 [Prochloraceae cyanobacterium]
MKNKLLKRILIVVGATIAMTAISARGAKAETNPQLIAQRNEAIQLAGVTAKTESDWLWALGEGTEQTNESYEINQNNSFFQSVEIPPRPDELFNRNNNIGDPLPEYGQVELVRF